MDKVQAQNIVKETFENPFDKDKCNNFVKNLLKRIENAPFNYQGCYVPDAFSNSISSYERIGKYSDGQNRIDIMVVKLKKETSIERARTMQRNFIAGYLAGKYGSDVQKEAALVAFVSPCEVDWRFSLVRLDYRFEESKKGRMKVVEEYTPARRWSFLVGKNEASHTAQSKLMPIIMNDEQCPTLAQLEEAFNVEKVSREFFEKYRELFVWTKDELDKIVKNDSKVRKDFESRDIDTVNFAKKLLGQIVFLYFLQKKGWFGVKRDENWGTGSKRFLRDLYEGKIVSYKNFFNDILEPLFYDALALDRSHVDHWNDHFKCKIPFLNGGLFDPIGNYDWVYTDINLPNDLFSNHKRTKEGDIGNGILDIFDRYNFTVKEDEPLDKEVAIDPEMLGKAYEKFNAIRPDNYDEYVKALKSGQKGAESKFNKQYGVYYTPREIVHYMCQQSLINYLYTELNQGGVGFEKLGEPQIDAFGNEVKKGQQDLTIEHRAQPLISKEDIETLIKQGEQFNENEARVVNKGKETATYPYRLPKSIRKNAELIDNKLAEIKVCDPAVGSGAFPVGMMTEIVKTRHVLSTFLSLRGAEATKQSRSIYDFKRQCIEKSLYGVDIDPGAVEIAKLRLWLSLIVDEEDIKQIKPLPNLDYKIVCGNSLLGFPDDWDSPIAKQIESLKQQFFNETNPTRKNELKKNIDEKIKNRYTDSYRYFGYQVNFDFKTAFSEVFHQKGGFDVVIANPPYVRQEKIKNDKPFLWKAGYEVFNSTSDLYTYFYEKAYSILAENKFLCFISSNKWMRAKYGGKLRRFFQNKSEVINLIDFKGYRVFEATVDTNIILLRKAKPSKNYRFEYVNVQSEKEPPNLIIYLENNKNMLPQSELNSAAWTLADDRVLKIKEKIEKLGTPLKNWDVRINRGIITGFNKAFIVDDKIMKRLCAKDSQSNNIIKPILRGRDIGRYYYKWAQQYLIKIESGWTDRNRNTEEAEEFFKSRYPAIYEHLLSFRGKQGKGKGLLNRDDQGDYWWELRDCDYYDEIEREKIVYCDIAKRLLFAYDNQAIYINNTIYFINTGNKYLLAVLNSQTMDFYYRQISSQLGHAALRAFTIYIEQLPIPKIPKSEQKPFIDLVDKILAITKDDDYLDNPDKQAKIKEYERQIDHMVYKLYDSTEEEIEIIENKVNKRNRI